MTVVAPARRTGSQRLRRHQVARAQREALLVAHRAAHAPVTLRVMDLRRWFGARDYTPDLGRRTESLLERVSLHASIRLAADLPPETEVRMNRVWVFTAGGYLLEPRLPALARRSRAGAVLLCAGALIMLLAGGLLAAPVLLTLGATRRMWVTGARSRVLLPVLLLILAAGIATVLLDGATPGAVALLAGSAAALAGALVTFGWIGRARSEKILAGLET